MINRYQAITNWLTEYVPYYSWIYFNVSSSTPDELSVSSVQNERVLEEYIDGTRTVEFPFAITLAKEYDTGTSDINLDAIQEFENISAWIEEQNEIENYPDFGDNITIEKIEVLETVPSVSVDNETGVAKYMAQYLITYMERR